MDIQEVVAQILSLKPGDRVRITDDAGLDIEGVYAPTGAIKELPFPYVNGVNARTWVNRGYFLYNLSA